MGILICGHQRSGTTILAQLCNSHPEILLTNEFGPYFHLDESRPAFSYHLLQRWWRAGNRSLILPQKEIGAKVSGDLTPRQGGNGRLRVLPGLRMTLRLLKVLRPNAGGIIGPAELEAGFQRVFPLTRFTGDKHPDYIFWMEKLSSIPGLTCLVMLRDPRDVISSSIRAYQDKWNKWWPDKMIDPGQVALRWKKIVAVIDRCADKIHLINYEHLIDDPAHTAVKLGGLLDLDPRKFRVSLVKPGSIGKYRQMLSPAVEEQILDLVAPEMRRFGYLS